MEVSISSSRRRLCFQTIKVAVSSSCSSRDVGGPAACASAKEASLRKWEVTARRRLDLERLLWSAAKLRAGRQLSN